MKFHKLFIASALFMAAFAAEAKNTTTEVKQVLESVTLTEDVDYVITANTPFGSMGSVNIENTEHAVVIIKNIRPSEVISKILPNHVFINGEQAVNNTNCQVKMFNRGAIILPYGRNFKPLTCYTEENYEGESYNNYTEGSDGGFMKTLTNTALNNKIRSFKLKRGYMVTFAVGTGGWGYSRCFIADLEDLEIPVMPAPFKGTISSYRLFKWQNASKAGVHDTSREANAALGTTSCFDWGQGNSSLLPDVEWVAHHIYEDWPSAATCGSVDGTCHMKTNNEPGNSADDHPQDVQTVLNNWQNLMRTGMRLCSESSHDGSMNHLKTFIEEIDKRGWRCDILDLHCYWDGQWNSLDWYIQEYGKGRPCWISEWVWGSSWGHAGAFADGRQNDDATYNGTKPILDRLNRTAKVERYFYWNSEAWYTKIWRDGSLTKLGRYYAEMDVPLAYNAANEYVPKIVCQDPGTIAGTYNKSRKTYKIDWTDPNGDLLASMELQCKRPGTTGWKTLAEIELKDQNSRDGVSYTYTDEVEEPGLYSYRVVTVDHNKTKRYSDEVAMTISAASATGTLGYGSIDVPSADEIATEFEPRVDETGEEVAPAIFMGMPSNKNTSNGVSTHVTSITRNTFKFRLNPWALPEAGSIDKKETIDYLLVPFGQYQLGEESHMLVEKIGSVKGDTLEVAFSTPFPEGSVPVVIVQNNSTSKSAAPTVVRAFDVTNTGFKVVLTRQEKATGTFTAQNTNYMAALPGTYKIGAGKLLTVYRDTTTPVGGSTYVSINVNKENGEPLNCVNPIIVGAAQTFNYGPTSCFRQQSTDTEEFTEGDQTYNGLTTIRVKRQHDTTTSNTTKSDKAKNGDYIGWFILSDDLNPSEDDRLVFDDPTAIRRLQGESLTVSTQGGRLLSNDTQAKAYNAKGQQVKLGSKVPTGVYIITNGKQSIKVIVK